MWRLMCVTLALLVCVKVYAHGPIHPRVAGGADAPLGAWPWMVSVHKNKRHFCGGSLITNEWVLSAAHCFIGSKFKVDVFNLRVYMGMWTQGQEMPQEFKSTVKAIYTHKSYEKDTNNNDIALLWLSSQVPLNNHIKLVHLAAKDSVIPSGTRCKIIGWGDIGYNQSLPHPGILQEADVFVVDNNQCHNQLKHRKDYTRITDNMICAGVPAGGVGAACGDSGGPLMTYDCSQWVQSGITSYGYGCARPNTPAVYTHVSQYQEWITDLIKTHPNQNLPQFVTISLPCSSASKTG